MMTTAAPYEALGVETTATEDEIKSAYRKAVRKYHPDIGGPDADAYKFDEISRAYESIQKLIKEGNHPPKSDPDPASAQSEGFPGEEPSWAAEGNSSFVADEETVILWSDYDYDYTGDLRNTKLSFSSTAQVGPLWNAPRSKKAYIFPAMLGGTPFFFALSIFMGTNSMFDMPVSTVDVVANYGMFAAAVFTAMLSSRIRSLVILSTILYVPLLVVMIPFVAVSTGAASASFLFAPPFALWFMHNQREPLDHQIAAPHRYQP